MPCYPSETSNFPRESRTEIAGALLAQSVEVCLSHTPSSTEQVADISKSVSPSAFFSSLRIVLTSLKVRLLNKRYHLKAVGSTPT